MSLLAPSTPRPQFPVPTPAPINVPFLPLPATVATRRSEVPANTWTWTPDQEAARASFTAFLESSEDAFVLRGAAGTGKTTLLGDLVTKAQRQGWRTMVTAPTGRAAWVLREKFGEQKVDSSTLHAFLYKGQSLEEVNEPEYGDLPLFRFRLRESVQMGKVLLIVDEASMVSEVEDKSSHLRFGSGSLLLDLLAWFNRVKPEGAKILFVGDPCQLPPVAEPKSPALDAAHLAKKHGLQVRSADLCTVLRQGRQSAILATAQVLRHRLGEAAVPLAGPLRSDLGILPAAQAVNTFLKEAERRGLDQTVLLAWRNQSVQCWNRQLRQRILGDSNEVMQGDLLSVTENHRRTGLMNGERVRVEHLGGIRVLENHAVRIVVREARVIYTSPKGPQTVDLTLLESLLWDTNRDLPFAVRILMWNYVKRTYPEVRKALHSKDRDAQQAAMEVLDRDPIFGALRVKPGYAITAHRAQGGEWPVVLVDGTRNRLRSRTELRWMYTALTRAQEQAWVVNPPAGEAGLLRELQLAHVQSL